LRAQAEAVAEGEAAMKDMKEKIEKFHDIEAKLQASEQQCEKLTQKSGELESKIKAAEDGKLSAEKEADHAKEELRRLSSSMPKPKAAPPPEPPKTIVKEVVPQKLLDQHKKEIEAVQRQVTEAKDEVKQVEEQRDEAHNTSDELRKELEDAKRRIAEAEARVPAPPAPEPPKKKEVPKREAGVQVALETKAPKEQPEEDVEKLKAQLEESKRRAKDAEQRAAELQEKLAVVPTKPPPEPKKESPRPPPPPARTGPSQEHLEELEALRKIAAEHEKAQHKIKKKDSSIAVLTEDKQALEDEKMQLLRALHQVKEQLRKVQEIAEKKGYGKLVAEIMSEAKVTEMVNSPEWSCFDRLYEDALRRQKKLRDIEQARFTGSGERLRQKGAVASGQAEMSPPGSQPGLAATWSGGLSRELSGPYHHAHTVVNNCPCIRCGYAPSAGGYFGSGGMEFSSRASSPSTQAKGLAREGSPLGRPAVADDTDPLPPQPRLRQLKSDVGPSTRTPAILADLQPVHPTSRQPFLQPRMMASPPPDSPVMVTSSSASNIGHVNISFSPGRMSRMGDIHLRNRSRSPIDLMLQQKAVPKLVHSRSEPKELPRLGIGEPLVDRGIPPMSPITVGRMKGSVVNDRFSMVRGVHRDRSPSSEAQKRGILRKRLPQEDFLVVGGGENLFWGNPSRLLGGGRNQAAPDVA